MGDVRTHLYINMMKTVGNKVVATRALTVLPKFCVLQYGGDRVKTC